MSVFVKIILPSISLAILLTLTACNSNDNATQIEEKAKTMMEEELHIERNSFEKIYKHVSEGPEKSSFKDTLTILYSSIHRTLNFIDSFRHRVNSFDNSDSKSLDSIRIIFIENEVGKEILHKLDNCYVQLLILTTTTTEKEQLSKIRSALAPENSKLLFDSNSPIGVTGILYGFSIQLLKDGSLLLRQKFPN